MRPAAAASAVSAGSTTLIPVMAADVQAKTNPWFKKVWDSQREFEKLWENASSYRNVKY